MASASRRSGPRTHRLDDRPRHAQVEPKMSGGRSVEDHQVVIVAAKSLVPDLPQDREVIQARHRPQQALDQAILEHTFRQPLVAQQPIPRTRAHIRMA